MNNENANLYKYKFHIKIIDNTEKEYVLSLNDISQVGIFLKELCNKLKESKANSYYTVIDIKNEKTLKYPSDSKKVNLGYIDAKNTLKEILYVQENYFQYYADKYNLFEFEIECKKYLGNPVNLKIQVNREQLAMGDIVGLKEYFIIKPFECFSSIFNRGSYCEYYKKTIINYTDLNGNEINEQIREEGNLLIEDMAFSQFIETKRIDIDKPIIIQQFKN